PTSAPRPPSHSSRPHAPSPEYSSQYDRNHERRPSERRPPAPPLPRSSSSRATPPPPGGSSRPAAPPSTSHSHSHRTRPASYTPPPPIRGIPNFRPDPRLPDPPGPGFTKAPRTWPPTRERPWQPGEPYVSPIGRVYSPPDPRDPYWDPETATYFYGDETRHWDPINLTYWPGRRRSQEEVRYIHKLAREQAGGFQNPNDEPTPPTSLHIRKMKEARDLAAAGRPNGYPHYGPIPPPPGSMNNINRPPTPPYSRPPSLSRLPSAPRPPSPQPPSPSTSRLPPPSAPRLPSPSPSSPAPTVPTSIPSRRNLADDRSQFFKTPRPHPGDFRNKTMINYRHKDFPAAGLRQWDLGNGKASYQTMTEVYFREISILFNFVVGLVGEIRKDWLKRNKGRDPKTAMLLGPQVRYCMMLGCSLLNYSQLMEHSIDAGIVAAETVAQGKTMPEILARHKRASSKFHRSHLGAVALADIVKTFLTGTKKALQMMERAGLQPPGDLIDIHDALAEMHANCMLLKSAILSESQERPGYRMHQVLGHPKVGQHPAFVEQLHYFIRIRPDVWRAFRLRLFEDYEGRYFHKALEELLHWSYLSFVLTEAKFVEYAWDLFSTLRTTPAGAPIFQPSSFLRQMWPTRAMRHPSPHGSTPEDGRPRASALRFPSPPGAFEMRTKRAEILRDAQREARELRRPPSPFLAAEGWKDTSGSEEKWRRLGPRPRFAV
ncbi:hypothetical protein P7C70_g8887, partial [Phenoliferia sp. Uapishka_3]